MKRKTILRLIAALLCVAMLMGVPALAVNDRGEVPEIPVGGEWDVVAELPELPVYTAASDDPVGAEAQPMSTTVFSVTVPTSVAIHMDASGGITCGNIVITNNSTESVLVKDTQVSALNDWTLVDYDTTSFTDANKGQHRVALRLDVPEGAVAANGGQKTIGVAAKIPYQGVQISNAAIAQVTFVVGWEVAQPPPAPPAALKSFTITVSENGATRTGGSWSDADDVVLTAVSQVGNNVVYEGKCTITAPYNNYMVYPPVITFVPANLQDGIVSIRVGDVGFTYDSGTWKGSSPLFYVGSTGGTFDVHLELTLGVATTVKNPTPMPSTPTPTPTPTG